jgi:hypothetical protein
MVLLVQLYVVLILCFIKHHLHQAQLKHKYVVLLIFVIIAMADVFAVCLLRVIAFLLAPTPSMRLFQLAIWQA